MKTLHASAHYAAYQHPRAGLIVQSMRVSNRDSDWPTQKGVNLRPDHPQYGEYVAAFETALDAVEGDALCRALFN